MIAAHSHASSTDILRTEAQTDPSPFMGSIRVMRQRNSDSACARWDGKLAIHGRNMLLVGQHKSLFYIAMARQGGYGREKAFDVVGHLHSSVLIV
jgi:hypothetical protein